VFIPIVVPITMTRKGIIRISFIMCIISAILAAVIVFLWVADQSKLQAEGQPDFNQLSMNQLEHGTIIHGSVDLIIDSYAESMGGNNKNRYYVVPIQPDTNNQDQSFQYFITLEAGPRDYKLLDKVIEQTWSNDPLTQQFIINNGRIRKISTELDTHLSQWVQSPDFYPGGSFIDWCVENKVLGTKDKTEIISRIAPFVINKTDAAGTDIRVALLFVGLLLFFLIMILFMRYYKKPIKGIDN
jgi:hypothetical protein